MSRPLGFADFVGNLRVVTVLRRMLSSGRIPHALLFAGQKGVGKFTLASMFARAANCQQELDHACGSCANCRALAALDDLGALERAALAARGSGNPEAVPLILRPHPCVSVLVPDGAYIRVGQMRHLVRQAYTMPAGGRRNVFLVDQAERLRFDYADVLLKVLEEPPEHTTIILVTAAPFELRSTVRSRCLSLYFAPVAAAEIENYLRTRPTGWGRAEQALAAAVAAGSLGTALSLDLERYRRVRREALAVVRAAAGQELHPELVFAATAALAGKGTGRTAETGEEREIFQFSLDILYSLLRDIVTTKAGTPEAGLHHPDLRGELQRLSGQASWKWLTDAVGHLDRIEGWLRRNVNRQLALDAWVLGFPRSSAGMG